MSDKNWNDIRVRKFMRRLAKRQMTFDNNVAVLALHAEISVSEFLSMDPISYGIKLWGLSAYNEPSQIIKKVLGSQIYKECVYLYSRRLNRVFPLLPPSPPDTPSERPSTPYEVPAANMEWCMSMP